MGPCPERLLAPGRVLTEFSSCPWVLGPLPSRAWKMLQQTHVVSHLWSSDVPTGWGPLQVHVWTPWRTQESLDSCGDWSVALGSQESRRVGEADGRLWLSLHLGVCRGRPRSPWRCVFENVLERYQVQNASLVAWSIGRSQTGRGHGMLVFVS